MAPADPAQQPAERTPGLTWDFVLNLLQVIGAGVALAGWVTVVGGARVVARFEGAGLPNPLRVVTVVPREALLAEGLRTLAFPLGLAALAAVALYLVLRPAERQRAEDEAALELFARQVQGGKRRPDDQFREYMRWRREQEGEHGHAAAARARSKSRRPSLGDRLRDTWDSLRDTWDHSPLPIPRPTSKLQIGLVFLVIVLVIIVLFLLLGLGLWSGLRWALGLPLLLVILVLIAASTTASRTSAMLFAMVAFWFGLLGILQERDDDSPDLAQVRVLAKDPADTIEGRYVARNAGDVYVATRPEEAGLFAITVIPKERVEAFTIGPRRAINRAFTPGGKGRDKKTEEELAPEPTYEPPDSASSGDPTAPSPQPSPDSTPQSGDAPVPLPDEPDPGQDVRGPQFQLPDIRAREADEIGSFLYEMLPFPEAVNGVFSLATQDKFDVPKTGRVRILLATLPFQGTADKRVLVRPRLSAVAHRVLRENRSMAVDVTVVAMDKHGNAERKHSCLVLKVRNAQRPYNECTKPKATP